MVVRFGRAHSLPAAETHLKFHQIGIKHHLEERRSLVASALAGSDPSVRSHASGAAIIIENLCGWPFDE